MISTNEFVHLDWIHWNNDKEKERKKNEFTQKPNS